jgi:CBS domain containing-hemolysin-like protein
MGVIATFATASFYCALAETAFFTLGQWRAKRLAEKNPERGPLVVQLLSRPQEILATLVLGNTVSNACIVAITLWIAHQNEWPMVLAIPSLLFLILLGCEVAPKTLAVRNPEVWSLRLAPTLSLLLKLTYVIRHVAEGMNKLILRLTTGKVRPAASTLSDDEYRELLEMAYQQGTLGESEKETIFQIIRLDKRTVREVMRPRSQMACISDDLSIEEMIAASRKSKHRRIPLYDENTDVIMGILNTRTLLLNPEIDLDEAIELASFVPDSMNLLHLLKSFQRQQRGMAIVLDEYGGTAGMVTMEDILEEMIGEIRSEAEETGFIMQNLEPGKWRVNGIMRIEDFRRELPEIETVEDAETMGGLMVCLAEMIPPAGFSVVHKGIRLVATVVDDRRVRELRVERLQKNASIARILTSKTLDTLS